MPEALKAPLRGRLFGFRQTAATLGVTFSTEAGAPIVWLDGVALRFREEDRRDMRYHLAENGESIEEMASFIALARVSRLVFDIGAAKGLFSHVFCLLNPANRSVAFEPSNMLLVSAEALADLNGCRSRISFRQCALGAAPGRAAGRVDPDGFMSVDPADAGGAPVDVEVSSVDSEIQRTGLIPDLLKIDVEGYELEVLQGARTLLGMHKPPICLELHLDLVERRGGSPSHIVRELQSHGYRFRTCAGRELRPVQIAQSMKALFRFVAI
jgi:FkbM family methyltransferase